MQAPVDLYACFLSVMGDTLGHRIDSTLNELSSGVKSFRTNMRDNTTEFLQEEINMVPPREAVEDFCSDIDEYAFAIERMAQRISALEDK